MIARPQAFCRKAPRYFRAGFTLWQLLIALVGMLATLALALPALKRQVEAGRSARCVDNLNRIGRGLFLYQFDHDGWWPQRRIWTQAGLVKDQNVWISLIVETKYVAEARTFCCPSDPNAAQQDSTTPAFFRRLVGLAPSYGMNQLTWRRYDTAPGDDDGMKRKPSRPERTLLLADKGPDYRLEELPAEDRDKRAFLELARDAGRLPADDGFRIGVVEPPRAWLPMRHGDSVHLSVMAGAVTTSHPAGRWQTQPLAKYYDDCATGDCTFCNVWAAPHYDFSASRIYWWTGR